jgi:amidohydrolase
MSDFKMIHEIIDRERANLVSIARAIHRRPELGGRENFAAKVISDYLEEHGFSVERGTGGLETAFRGRFGKEGFHVAYCAEYDALPEIGHGCGHNLIGIASVAAGLALAGSLDDLKGQVSVIGTPNEEGEGGKVDLVRAGVFDDVDAAMMFHPGCSTKIHTESLACSDFKFIFHGKNAHAACEPWEGRNALDGVILTFNGINALRQHLKDDVRIHGIISEGGLASNIIPDRAVAEICIRARENETLGQAAERVIDCARGAALASGTRVEILPSKYSYDAMKSNSVLAGIFSESLEQAGYDVKSGQEEGMGSIDMGNVSRATPSIHPVLALTADWVPGHTTGFTDLCNTEEAYEVMLAAGRAMAITGLRVLRDPVLQQKIREEFLTQVKKETE